MFILKLQACSLYFSKKWTSSQVFFKVFSYHSSTEILIAASAHCLIHFLMRVTVPNREITIDSISVQFDLTTKKIFARKPVKFTITTPWYSCFVYFGQKHGKRKFLGTSKAQIFEISNSLSSMQWPYFNGCREMSLLNPK